jgi:hypothetical protein
MQKLKYQHIQPATHIRAYDFIPSPDRGECYMEGVVEGHHKQNMGAWFLAMRITREVWAGKPRQDARVGEMIYVPMETCNDAEFEELAGINRVQVIS